MNTENIMTEEETNRVVARFWVECLNFWKGENATDPYEKAAMDVGNLSCDPFNPNGKKLHEETLKSIVDNLK